MEPPGTTVKTTGGGGLFLPQRGRELERGGKKERKKEWQREYKDMDRKNNRENQRKRAHEETETVNSE